MKAKKRVLFKAKWFVTNTAPRSTATQVEDKCGFLQINGNWMLPNHCERDERMANPTDVEQVFFVKDNLHRGWLFVVHSTPRSSRVFYGNGGLAVDEGLKELDDIVARRAIENEVAIRADEPLSPINSDTDNELVESPTLQPIEDNIEFCHIYEENVDQDTNNSDDGVSYEGEQEDLRANVEEEDDPLGQRFRKLRMIYSNCLQIANLL